MARRTNGRVRHVRVPGNSYKRGDTDGPITEKNIGLNSRGWEFWHATDCPCSVCGHTLQEECDAAGCDCCSSFCT